MKPHLEPTARLLFIGDSITDSGRTEPGYAPLGHGFVKLIAESLSVEGIQSEVINRGIGGNRVQHLRERWTADCVELNPTIVTIFAGINDTWRRYDANVHISLEAFEADYRTIVQRTLSETTAQVIVISPFLLPVRHEQQTWYKEDLIHRIKIIEQIANEEELTFLSADRLLRSVVGTGEFGVNASLAADGIHPTPKGHRIIADSWLATVASQKS